MVKKKKVKDEQIELRNLLCNFCVQVDKKVKYALLIKIQGNSLR